MKTVKSLRKSEVMKPLSLVAKDLHFTFDRALFKQIDGLVMDPPLGLMLVNPFFVYHQRNWLESCLFMYIVFKCPGIYVNATVTSTFLTPWIRYYYLYFCLCFSNGFLLFKKLRKITRK